MKEKITELRHKLKPKQTKLVLSDPDVKKHLKELHRKFVIFIIDKAANNFGFISRKYKIFKLLAEISPNKNKNSTSTHSQTQNSEEELIKTHIK